MKEPFILSNTELEAEIYYLTADEGGRSSPVGNGYRGQLFYDDNDWDAAQEFVDKDICLPGETVICFIKTARPELHLGKFYIGKNFEIREGNTIVARGKITKIFRQDFLNNA
jgi:translation elongation factor EF-Tu-like GTPase